MANITLNSLNLHCKIMCFNSNLCYFYCIFQIFNSISSLKGNFKIFSVGDLALLIAHTLTPAKLMEGDMFLRNYLKLMFCFIKQESWL